MNVITISRQLGSLGYEIGEAIAEKKQYRLYGREVINQSAMLCGVPEIALAMIDELGLLGLSPTEEECRAYFSCVENLMMEYAKNGRAVIVGRAGQTILKNIPGAFHVRIIAPVDTRIKRIQLKQKISSEAALAQIQKSDRYRKNYLKKYYQINWDDPEIYDLVINTKNLSVHMASELICNFLD
jgi:cytidylate kinase